MDKAFTTTTLADQVEEKIIAYIKENKLGPGDSLPNEMQFVEMLGISRNVVREAMSRLRMLGVIQSRTKRGIIITEPSLLTGFKKVIDPGLMSVETIKELMGMRIALELGITDFVFRNVTSEDIENLEKLVSRQEVIGAGNLSVEEEVQFHSLIYTIAGNKFILQFQEIMHPVFVFTKQNYESYFAPFNEKLKEEGELITHAHLLACIKDGDQEAYRMAMSRHLSIYWEFIHNFEKSS